MNQRRLDFRAPLFGIAAAFVMACGTDDGGPTDGAAPMETDAAVCVAPGDDFSVGISKTSMSGMTVTIEDANPAPPGVGTNGWRIAVKDGAGNGISGAVVNFGLYMPPPHGHSMPGTVGKDMGNGVYTAADLNFLMPGLVDITVQVAPASGATDKVMFQFCVKRAGN